MAAVRALADYRPVELEVDELYPCDAENRYRIYAVVGDERTILATAASPAGVGQALVQLHEDQKEIGRALSDIGRIGVFDTRPEEPKGEWIVLPWDRRFG